MINDHKHINDVCIVTCPKCLIFNGALFECIGDTPLTHLCTSDEGKLVVRARAEVVSHV